MNKKAIYFLDNMTPKRPCCTRCGVISVRLWNFKEGGSKKARFLVKNQYTQTLLGIKYSNQEYTRVEYPMLGYFRVQVPENLRKQVWVVSNWPGNFQVNSEHNFNTWKNPKVERQRYHIDKTFKKGQFRIRILSHRLICVLNQLKNCSYHWGLCM